MKTFVKRSSAAIAAILLTCAVAGASCGNPNTSRSATTKANLSQGNGTGQGNRSGSIVGLWLVNYSFGAQSFDQWHADGNEFEVANLAPGVVCQGTWAQAGPGVFKLVHLGWNFDFSGNLIGYYVETQLNTMSGDGASYNGTFDFKFYFNDGTRDYADDFSGTLTATRISPN